MAYEFKKLSDVNVIEEMKDGLNVLVEDGGEIVKISANSMIPEDVALKSDIPTKVSELENDANYVSAPLIAEVGQVIAVKAVDENGKPTEWEAVDSTPEVPYITVFYCENDYLYHFDSISNTVGNKVTKAEFDAACRRGVVGLGVIESNFFMFSYATEVAMFDNYGRAIDNNGNSFCTAEYDGVLT